MPEGVNKDKRSCVFTDLGLLAYKRALSIQLETLAYKMDNPGAADQIFFVEHPSVFTLGKRGGKENIGVSQSFLDKRGIEIVQTDRGGNITYHGPGQAVMYPVVDLEKNKFAVKEFVMGLEETMRLTAADFGIQAHRDARNHGIWVKNAKIGSVGIAVKKGISLHGLALNINLDLEPFTWINPCGLANISMTSVEKELSGHFEEPGGCNPISMDAVKAVLADHFSNMFNYSHTWKKTFATRHDNRAVC